MNVMKGQERLSNSERVKQHRIDYIGADKEQKSSKSNAKDNLIIYKLKSIFWANWDKEGLGLKNYIIQVSELPFQWL